MVKGFIAGTWDLFHAGHVLALEEAKTHCDVLIVGLQSENIKRKPIQNLYERFVQLSACCHVDSIFPYSTEKDLENLLLTNKFDVRFLGEDYYRTDKPVTGKNSVERIVYIARKHNYSTTALIEKIEKNYVNDWVGKTNV